jgi:nitroreductase
MDEAAPVPHGCPDYPPGEMLARAASFRELMARRRSVRRFSDRPVPREVVEHCIMTAASAPSGANMQPWRFVAVGDPETKRRIREAAEREEAAFYAGRAGSEWLGALKPIGTGPQKPFLETASWLIVVFAEPHGLSADKQVVKHYYVSESVGIATGLLLAAVHNAGLAALTYTPSRIQFLAPLLGRPEHERAFLVLVVGYPDAEATVPALQRKSIDQVAEFR